jgi:hypothetical protein
MSKHTPGPWVVNGFGGDFIVLARLPRGVAISAKNPPGRGDEIADARLIAAAPDLLEALKECSGRLKIHMKHTEDLMADMKAQKAIARAEGKA